MTRRNRILTTLLATSLASAALAMSDHHSAGAATDDVQQGPGGMGAMHGMSMPGHGGAMGSMHDMMAQMHGAPSDAMGGMMHGASPSMPALADLSGEEYEVAFLSMMIAHHQGAVEMAEWILDRTDDPEIRSAAEAIVAAQDPEIQQMTTWLRDWYDQGVAAEWAEMMHADMGGMMDAMEEGEDPDTAFLEEMIRHHQGAIDMAQLALERATHQELRDLARDVVLAQADEVHQYQTWLNDAQGE